MHIHWIQHQYRGFKPGDGHPSFFILSLLYYDWSMQSTSILSYIHSSVMSWCFYPLKNNKKKRVQECLGSGVIPQLSTQPTTLQSQISSFQYWSSTAGCAPPHSQSPLCLCTYQGEPGRLEWSLLAVKSSSETHENPNDESHHFVSCCSCSSLQAHWHPMQNIPPKYGDISIHILRVNCSMFCIWDILQHWGLFWHWQAFSYCPDPLQFFVTYPILCFPVLYNPTAPLNGA